MLGRQVVQCCGLVSVLSQMEFKGGRGGGRERKQRDENQRSTWERDERC